ncbi:MAG: sulfurtransferase [Betaproteobacteria bacterium]|nr:sulfurtransferase [Betaproteobacteria bacterium]
MQQMTVQQLHAVLSEPDGAKPLLLDVREPWEWQLARIEGSQHIPMGDIPARAQELDKTQSTVVICHHGVRSLQVVAFLQRFGFDQLHNLQGGIDAWSRQVDPAVALY